MWNSEIYNKFGKERLQPSIDLLNRVDINTCNRIIDIGCGSGMSTLPLRKRFPSSEIIGIDLSENMLESAKHLMEDVTWIKRDCSKKLNDLGAFDLVFSNAFLQWVDNQSEFIMNTKELLVENGVFAIQVPAFEEMEIAQIIKEMAAEFNKEKKVFNNMDQSLCYNYSLREYYDMFTRHYSKVEIWQTNYIHQMKDQHSIIEFIKGTALLPYLQRLNDTEAKDFLDRIYLKTKQSYPQSENGSVLFEFKRLFIIARR